MIKFDGFCNQSLMDVHIGANSTLYQGLPARWERRAGGEEEGGREGGEGRKVGTSGLTHVVRAVNATVRHRLCVRQGTHARYKRRHKNEHGLTCMRTRCMP